MIAMRWGVRRLQRSLEHADLGRLPGLLAAKREEGQRNGRALRRLVEDLPIAQFAARAQRDIARADAAQGKCQGAGAMVVASDAFVMFHLLTFHLRHNLDKPRGYSSLGFDRSGSLEAAQCYALHQSTLKNHKEYQDWYQVQDDRRHEHAGIRHPILTA